LKKTLKLPDEPETIISTSRGERSFHSGRYLKKQSGEANKDNGAARRSSASEVYTDTSGGSSRRSTKSERLNAGKGAGQTCNSTL